MTKANVIRAYELGAEDAGYIVKCNVCEEVDDLQFLKHSYVEHEDGQRRAIMNLAPFFRGYGKCPGDLNSVYGKSSVPLEIRTARYNRDVHIGRLNWGKHAINDAFEIQTSSINFGMTVNALREDLINKSIGRAEVRISLESLSRRYRCEPQELAELCDYIARASVGCLIKHEVLARIYLKDYG